MILRSRQAELGRYISENMRRVRIGIRVRNDTLARECD